LLKITRGFGKIGAGETMEIMGEDSDIRRDFFKVSGPSPCAVLCVRDAKDPYHIRLTKGRRR
jgi:hypothetical protein